MFDDDDDDDDLFFKKRWERLINNIMNFFFWIKFHKENNGNFKYKKLFFCFLYLNIYNLNLWKSSIFY